MLEQKLLKEVERFRSISRNASNLNEQELPAVDDAPADLPAPGADAPVGGLPEPGADAGAPAPDANAMPMTDAPAASDTEEVDVTDLVNMTKNIKNDLEATKGEHTQVLTKMDDIFTKLSALENMHTEMSNVISKIDELGSRIEAIKPPTAVEKLEMRSLDSYPFNQKPNDFFSQKQREMQASGKNEYVLTKDDVENYSKDEIAKSFNPDNMEQEEENEDLYGIKY
jgi:hypothetical protein